MAVRLADGLVAPRGARVWARGPGGAPVDAAAAAVDPAAVAPGTAVAVGPGGAGAADAAHAVAELTRLVEAGGAVVAGAGVDLGGGFTSARLDGVRGVARRDAVFAALRALGLDGAGRLGDRAAVLVALFGPAATKRVGAAASEAIRHGQWAAVHLATAASDLLGPEQLERVLGLTVPAGAAPSPLAAPSRLAADLRVVLGGVPPPRRLDLLVDLWHTVCTAQQHAARRDRLRASQGRRDRTDDLRQRREHYEDEEVLARVRAWFGRREPTLAEAARWDPSGYEAARLQRMFYDAVAATVLLRTAVAVSDHGLAAGLARCRHLLAAVATHPDDPRARRRVPGRTGLPARPGQYLRDIHHRLERGGLGDLADPVDPVDPAAQFVAQRLAAARDYGQVVQQAVVDCLAEARSESGPVRSWAAGTLPRWRAAAGYTAVRPPQQWQQPPVFPIGEHVAPLAHRLRERPQADPAEVETMADLLWYADLADALAQLYGHDAATVDYGRGLPWCTVDPPDPPPAPLHPRTGSVAAAVAGAAQLVGLGARPPRRARTWTGLVDDLLASAAVAEALTSTFAVPVALADADGAVVPGTRARFEVARSPRQLADWSAYLGNCIAGSGFVQAAAAGRCVLAALRDEDGRLLANAELRPARPAGRGWRVAELRARFNDDPDPQLAAQFTGWVATLAAPPPPARPAAGPAAAEPAEPSPPRRPGAPRARTRLSREVGQALGRLAEPALADAATVAAVRVLAAVAQRLGRPAAAAAGPDRTADPLACLTALRRAAPARLAAACRETLRERLRGTDPHAPSLPELWDAAGVRPLATALAGLDPGLPARPEQLELLLVDAPLPGSLRPLARRPGVAPARSVDLVGLRLRTAIGRLARGADPVLAEAMVAHPRTSLLCPLVLAVTSWTDPPPVTAVTEPGAVTVPGFPVSRLSDQDGPWQRAWPHARELGAASEPFWRRIADRGLLVPTAWLDPGGWPALWSRAARYRRAVTAVGGSTAG